MARRILLRLPAPLLLVSLFALMCDCAGAASSTGAGSLLSDGTRTYTYDGRELLWTVSY